MNKKKITLVVLLLSGILIFLPPQLTRNKTDHWAIWLDTWNPFVETETVYARIPETPSGTWIDARYSVDYLYLTTTFNSQGKTRNIQLTSFGNERLAPLGHYLKITIKGQAVLGYESVTFDEIPKKSLQQLRKQLTPLPTNSL